MVKENYVAKFDNVECVVKFVNAPKDEKYGYSYALNVHNPAKELLPYLSQDNYHSIKMFSFDKEPRFSTNQKITFSKMGITAYGDGKFCAHNINIEKEPEEMKKEPLKKESPTNYKELPQDPGDDEGRWLVYRQRLNEIYELAKTHSITSDTAISSAILGLRELMFSGKVNKW